MQYMCKTFRWKRSMLKHIRWTHLEVQPFQCNTCKKNFLRNANLKRHMSIHTGETPYNKGDFLCNHCDKSLTSLRNFTKHSYIHSGEKPFQCTLCSKRFRQKSQWQSHNQDHTREKLLYEALSG